MKTGLLISVHTERTASEIYKIYEIYKEIYTKTDFIIFRTGTNDQMDLCLTCWGSIAFYQIIKFSLESLSKSTKVLKTQS